jgi:hypothetical protein
MTWWRISRRVRGCARTVQGCSNQNPQGGGLFFDKEQERERDEVFLRFGKEKGGQQAYLLATWDQPTRGTCGQSAAPSRMVREVRGRSDTPARTVRYLLQNAQCCSSSPRAARTVRAAGRSARSDRTVQPTAADCPTFLYIFSVIYSEIEICKSIFWDHCSRIMKETCHMMQCTNQC